MAAGIDCIVVPRKEADGKAISASTVRQCLQTGDWDTLETLLPQTCLAYFRSPEAAPRSGTHPQSGECGALLKPVCISPGKTKNVAKTVPLLYNKMRCRAGAGCPAGEPEAGRCGK